MKVINTKLKHAILTGDRGTIAVKTIETLLEPAGLDWISAKSPSRVGAAFRTLKSAELCIRPIYHWLDHRVKAHAFLRMLASYVEWRLRQACAHSFCGSRQTSKTCAWLARS